MQLRTALVAPKELPDRGRRSGASHNNLGTINGCYIPCLLNILGAPLFLFVGFSVGMMGWTGALALFCFCELIAYLTITSFSALVTNGRMRGGGAYFMISRSLGPAFGGSSGLLFWITYCLNVTFNTRSFTDVVFQTFFEPAWPGSATFTNELAFSSATLFFLFLVAFKGAAAFARVNSLIFLGLVVALAAAIGSVWLQRTAKTIVPDLGALPYTPADAGMGGLAAEYRPWAWDAPCTAHAGGGATWCLVNGTGRVFAFVFPAVVGMMEGANLSGDLADPGHSIPRGTLGAVSTAFICYVLLILGQAGTVDRGALQFDLSAMQHLCVSPIFVVLGVATACLSTALGSMFGSARILQAIARDRILPLAPFAHGALRGDEPRRALCLTWALAQCGLFIGGIDAVAPVLTNFFLVTYALTNLAAAVLELCQLPNFRPAWRVYSWHLSLAGVGLTLFAMLFLNPVFAAVTLVLALTLSLYIGASGAARGWPSVSQAVAFLLARAALATLDEQPADAKYWRPAILLLLPAPQPPPHADGVAQAAAVPPPPGAAPVNAARFDASPALLHLVHLMSASGLVICGRVLTPACLVDSPQSGNGVSLAMPCQRVEPPATPAPCGRHVLSPAGGGSARRLGLAHAQLKQQLQAAWRQYGLRAYDQLSLSPSLRLGVTNLLLGAGLGPLKPDTLMLSLPDRADDGGVRGGSKSIDWSDGAPGDGGTGRSDAAHMPRSNGTSLGDSPSTSSGTVRCGGAGVDVASVPQETDGNACLSVDDCGLSLVIGDALALGKHVLLVANTGGAGAGTVGAARGADAETLVGGVVDIWLFGPPPGFAPELDTIGADVADASLASEADAHLALAAQFGCITANALAAAQTGCRCKLWRRACARGVHGGTVPSAPTSAHLGPKMRVLQLHMAYEHDPADLERQAVAIRAWLKAARLDAQVVQVPIFNTVDGPSASPRAHAPADPETMMYAHHANRTPQPLPPTWIHEPRIVAMVNEAIRRHSLGAALILLPLPPPTAVGGGNGSGLANAAGGNGDAYAHALRALTNGLPPTVLARSNGYSVITTEI